MHPARVMERSSCEGIPPWGLMGHFGVAKTYDILCEHFYWPKMKRDVERFWGGVHRV